MCKLSELDKERIRESIYDVDEAMSDLEYYADHEYDVSDEYKLKVEMLVEARRGLARLIDNEFD